jgi:hypothetical protein
LAPLQLNTFDNGTPSSVGIERQYSVSSTGSSGHLTYYPSPCGSGASIPVTSRLRRTTTHASHRSHPYRSASGPEQLQNEKNPRRKRSDRQKFSRVFGGNAKPSNLPKDQSEAGNRFDLTATFGLIEKQLMRMSPTLCTDAALGDGRTKLGWKALHTNNVSKDVGQPLLHNKIEIHISSIQVMRHSDTILKNCNEERVRLQTKAHNMLRSNASETEIRNFLKDFANFNWSECVMASCSKRGCSSFQLPFSPHSAL